MAGVSETCNHVVTALFRVEAAVCSGLTNPSCASSASEWLLCRKDIESTKNKDLNFDREDFAHRVKKKRPLVDSPKKTFKPLSKSNKKPLPLIHFTSALEEIAPNSILSTSVPKPKINFFREIITEWAGETDVGVRSIESLVKLSKTKKKFLKNLELLSIKKLKY